MKRVLFFIKISIVLYQKNFKIKKIKKHAKKFLTFTKMLIMFCCVMETWQSWFNAPDLKSDEGASPPGVRIPAFPPDTITPSYMEGVVVFDKNYQDSNPGKRGLTTSERRAKERRSAES